MKVGEKEFYYPVYNVVATNKENDDIRVLIIIEPDIKNKTRLKIIPFDEYKMII